VDGWTPYITNMRLVGKYVDGLERWRLKYVVIAIWILGLIPGAFFATQ
jgi:hypothetical protein